MTWRIADTPIDGPASEPVTLAECKLDSRVDGTEFDTVIPTLITAARQMCEQASGRKLITQTWRLQSDEWPDDEHDTFVLSPYQSAVVNYWNGVEWATLPSDRWAITNEHGALLLRPAYGLTFPSLGNLVGPRVRADVTCGYGNAAAVPDSLKMWIRAHVAAMLRTPDGHGDGSKMAPLQYLRGLLDPHKVYA